MQPLMTSAISGLQKSSPGKVRDIYSLDHHLIIVTTDRISAFDWVLPTGIPDKGRVLQSLTRFWVEESNFGLHSDLITTNVLTIANFLLTANKLAEAASALEENRECFEGRIALVRKAKPFPVECVVRGYLAGSAWKEYQEHGSICNIILPSGLKESEALPDPIFTPATKAEQGQHDENISFDRMCEMVGTETAEDLRRRSLELYRKGQIYAAQRGIIIADTKFEFGIVDGAIVIIDEILTPDSSRFWPADQYEPGREQN